MAQNLTYLTTTSELNSVANAIREKGGTSEQLEYPQGFIDAIDDIEAGGGSIEVPAGWRGFVPTTLTVRGSRCMEEGIWYGALRENYFSNAQAGNEYANNIIGITFNDLSAITTIPGYSLCNLGVTSPLPSEIFENAQQVGQFACIGTASGIPTNLKLTSLTGGVAANAFNNCRSIQTLTLGAGCTEINMRSFAYCDALTTVYFLGTPTFINNNAFNSDTNITDIYVPWAEGAVANAPWGATNATIHYEWTPTE